MNGLISVIIPSCNEPYLQKTIQDLINKASEPKELEIIAILDGWWPKVEEFVEDPRVIYIHTTRQGMREAINKGVSIAHGEFILKVDAHCMFSKGYDKVLKDSYKDNWVVIPTRKRFDPEKWELIKDDRPDIDYLYLAYPEDQSVWGGKGLQAKEWREKNEDRSLDKIRVDDLMSAQGSCYFMKKDYFHWLELMDEKNYGEFTKEMQEIGLKCWLSGGRMVRNKNCWYAHWHKTKTRGYSLNKEEWRKGTEYTMRWFTDDFYTDKTWHKQKYEFSWLIRKFWPVPTWPENYSNRPIKKLFY